MRGNPDIEQHDAQVYHIIAGAGQPGPAAGGRRGGARLDGLAVDRSSTPTDLTHEVTTATVALTEAHRAQMVTVANAASEGASPLMLRIEGVTQARSGQFYQLFVNLPSGMSPDPAGVHFVGNLVMFGHVHDGAHIHTGASFLYDISELVRTLEASGAFTGDLALTFVPQIPGSPAGTYMEFDHVSIGNLI